MFRTAATKSLAAGIPAIGARAFSTSPAAQAAAEVNKIAVIGAGQMVQSSSQFSKRNIQLLT